LTVHPVRCRFALREANPHAHLHTTSDSCVCLLAQRAGFATAVGAGSIRPISIGRRVAHHLRLTPRFSPLGLAQRLPSGQSCSHGRRHARAGIGQPFTFAGLRPDGYRSSHCGSHARRDRVQSLMPASRAGSQRCVEGLLAGRLLAPPGPGLTRLKWLATMPATVRATAFTSSGSSKIISTVA
jgi:hypothetical protein